MGDERTEEGAVRAPPGRRDDSRSTVEALRRELAALREAEQQDRAARAYAEAIIDTVEEPLIVLDEGMRIVSAGRSFYRYFAASPEDTLGRLLPDSDARHLDVPALRAFLGRIKPADNHPHHCEIEVDLPPPRGRRTLAVTARPIHHAGAAPALLLVALNDITDHRRTEARLLAARQAAENANLTKSRFLAAVSHDLRQPLQALTLLHGLLRDHVADAAAADLLRRATVSLDGMAGMLNALLDINQLEAGYIRPQIAAFPLDDLFDRLDGEFAPLVAARGLDWRVVRCRLGVRSDPRLFAQMLRNLLSNAIRYTGKGRILLGCRRRRDRLRVEVWDTGIGIAESDISRIFEEFQKAADHPDDNGLGLGLAIVRRLSEFLGHPVEVRSSIGKGSMFGIEVPLAAASPARRQPQPRAAGGARPRGAILVIEDNAPLSEMLQMVLQREGHRTAAAAGAAAALNLIGSNGFRPDLIVADYILPGGVNGAQALAALRERLGHAVPVVFLTGDTRGASLPELAMPDSTRLVKPVKPDELVRAIGRLLARSPPAEETPAAPAPAPAAATILVVDDDPEVRRAMRELLIKTGYRVETFADGEALLANPQRPGRGCLVIDVRLPGIGGFELLARLAAAGNALPAILVTGHGDIAMAVEAMRAGAVDFVEKPVRVDEFLACIDRALRNHARPDERTARRRAAALRVAGLTRREREVLEFVIAGHANKEIAARLGIAQRTVESHRAQVMRKMGAHSLSELVRLSLAAERDDRDNTAARD